MTLSHTHLLSIGWKSFKCPLIQYNKSLYPTTWTSKVYIIGWFKVFLHPIFLAWKCAGPLVEDIEKQSELTSKEEDK